MSGVKRCGKCGKEFTPEPYFYGGGNLCQSCRDRVSSKIDDAKEAYDKLPPGDRHKIDFASTVSERLPSATNHCRRCGTKIDDNETYCNSCYETHRREEKEREKQEAKEAEKRRRDYEKKMNKL